jgi:secondary thiamine-phosphate synthase enzyme
MVVVTVTQEVTSRGENDIVDITSDVSRAVRESKLGAGVVAVFVAGSTAAVTTMEFEPGLAKDLPRALEVISPKEWEYEHQKTRKDGNGHSHVKAAIVGPSVVVPFQSGELMLGRWQQVVYVEFDIRPRTRRLVLQIIGE